MVQYFPILIESHDYTYHTNCLEKAHKIKPQAEKMCKYGNSNTDELKPQMIADGCLRPAEKWAYAINK